MRRTRRSPYCFGVSRACPRRRASKSSSFSRRLKLWTRRGAVLGIQDRNVSSVRFVEFPAPPQQQQPHRRPAQHPKACHSSRHSRVGAGLFPPFPLRDGGRRRHRLDPLHRKPRGVIVPVRRRTGARRDRANASVAPGPGALAPRRRAFHGLGSEGRKTQPVRRPRFPRGRVEPSLTISIFAAFFRPASESELRRRRTGR